MNQKFWKHYFIFLRLACVLIIALLAAFWINLDAYEKSLPVYEAQRITDLFNNERTLEIANYLSIEEGFNTKKSLQNILKANIKDGKFKYEKKRGLFKKDKPIYSILNDNKEVATLELKKSSQKGIMNTSKWEIKKLSYHFEKEDLIIYALPDEVITINGIEVSPKYITQDNYVLDKLENVLGYVNITPLIKYEINDIYKDSKIEFAKGTYTKEDSTYTYNYPEKEDLLNNHKDFLINWCKNYTKYVVNEATFGSISSSVVINSNAYDFLKKVASTNIWLASHTQTVFSDFTFENMQMYTDDLYSVDIKYSYSFYVNNDLKEYQTELTLYLININGNWLIADLTT